MALQRGVVELEKYNLKWKEEYENEEKLLKKVLKDKIIEIHHIGSTSIEGLKAKPVIDILIVINSLNEIKEIEEILSKYDYSNRGPQGVDDRLFFAKGPETARTHYIHFTEPKSKTYYNQIYFKRYLIDHPEYIKEYCDLKEKLAKLYANERTKYTQGKNEFITQIINLAKEEYDMEMLDIYNENHEKIGVCEKTLTHKLGLWHEVFTCLIINKESKSIYFQIKNHSHNNLHDKDLIEISVGGHLQAGEKIENGTREIKEETGIDVCFQDLISLGVRQVSMNVNENYKVREFQHIFLYPTSKKLSSFKGYDKEEVSDFIEIKINDLIDLLLNKTDSIVGKLNGYEQSLTLDNFVSTYLTGDKLYLRLAIASKRYIEGENPELIFW